MANAFQKYHLLRILDLFEGETLPLDIFLSHYFRANKAVGAKDRRTICEAIYGMIRWCGLLDHLLPKPPTWESRFSLFTSINPHDFLQKEEIPAHIRVSFPKEFFQILERAFGEKKAQELCLASNQTAPTTIRVNSTKISRDSLLEKWKELYSVSPSTISPDGIIFHKKINFFSLPEFKEGLFEIQDEGSQLVASLLEIVPGQQILDYCAGSGGKTLAFAPQTKKRGQIFLHDIRPRALLEAKKRLKRAGIQNAQILLPTDAHKETLKGRMDWVLVDAPCSGSGTLRRNPDMKWKFSSELLERVVQEQRKIVTEALDYLSPKGYLVYATCSILPQENEEQVAFFEKELPLLCIKPPFSSTPQKGGMDGFFGAVFRRRS